MRICKVVPHLFLITLHAEDLIFKNIQLLVQPFKQANRIFSLRVEHFLLLELLLRSKDIILNIQTIIFIVRQDIQGILRYLQQAFVEFVRCC